MKFCLCLGCDPGILPTSVGSETTSDKQSIGMLGYAYANIFSSVLLECKICKLKRGLLDSKITLDAIVKAFYSSESILGETALNFCNSFKSLQIAIWLNSVYYGY